MDNVYIGCSSSPHSTKIRNIGESDGIARVVLHLGGDVHLYLRLRLCMVMGSSRMVGSQ